MCDCYCHADVILTFQVQQFSLVTGLGEQSSRLWKTEAMEHLMEGRKNDNEVDVTFMQNVHFMNFEGATAVVMLPSSTETGIPK